MTTALYARISLDRQDGAGVERQLEDCRALAVRNGWKDPVEYVDNNASASKSAKPRPAFEAMIEAVRAGDVDRIVVYHVDRLYRRPRELEDAIDLAEQGRVRVISVHSGDLNLSNSDGAAMARVTVAFAAKESADKSRRVKRELQQRREKGEPVWGRRPFGWRDAMTPEPTEAAIIREGADLLLGGMSLADLARRWNAQGVRTAQSKKAKKPTSWTADTVRRVMSNPRHAGLVGHHTEIRTGRYADKPVVVGKAKWPAIIDPEKWSTLRALLDHRGSTTRGVPRRRSLLTSLLTCGKCGATMVRTGARPPAPGKRSAWRCPWGKEGACGACSIVAEPLEAWLTEATLQQAEGGALAAKVRARADGTGVEAEKLSALDERAKALAAAWAAGTITLQAYAAATAALGQERTKLEEALARTTTSAAVAPYVGRGNLLRKRWSDLTLDQRRAIIGAALGRIVIGPPTPGLQAFDPDRVTVMAADK